jgi:hypothetical protein
MDPGCARADLAKPAAKTETDSKPRIVNERMAVSWPPLNSGDGGSGRRGLRYAYPALCSAYQALPKRDPPLLLITCRGSKT